MRIIFHIVFVPHKYSSDERNASINFQARLLFYFCRKMLLLWDLRRNPTGGESGRISLKKRGDSKSDWGFAARGRILGVSTEGCSGLGRGFQCDRGDFRGSGVRLSGQYQGIYGK